MPGSTDGGAQSFTCCRSYRGRYRSRPVDVNGTLDVMRGQLVLLALTVLATLPTSAGANPHPRADMTQRLLAVAREHRSALEAELPRRERAVRDTAASLDRNSLLYARGAIQRVELDRAARDAGEARAQLERTRAELVRTTALVVEIEARRRLALLPPLRPGQYEASEGLIRYAGPRELSPGALVMLDRHFVASLGRTLPVSAMGQTDVHTRLGLDHRHAVDLALHPDSAEGRLVMAWLRERGVAFLAYRGPRTGAATGAHIHVGRPSERVVPRPLATAASAALGGGARSRPP